MPQNNLFIGTSGWSYSNWKGIFYAEKCKSADFLSFYCTKFNCTEINSTFYNFPRETTIEKWLNIVPEHFKFTLKLHRSITHFKKLKNCEAETDNFFEIIKPLKEKTGPILIQLPPSFQFNFLLVEEFLSMLKQKLYPFSYALEARHASWFNDNALQLLEKFNISWVIADAGKFYPSYNAITSNSVYFRFHGRTKLFASLYEDEELQPFAEQIQYCLTENLKVFVFFNNTMHGHAILNANKLRQMLNF